MANHHVNLFSLRGFAVLNITIQINFALHTQGVRSTPYGGCPFLISKLLQPAPKSSSFWQGCRNPVAWMWSYGLAS